MSFERDELIEGGRKGKMSNGVNYREIRQYHRENHLIRFYFVTRCYNTYVESILSDLSRDPKPDIILMNSCLWDISRSVLKIYPSLRKTDCFHANRIKMNEDMQESSCNINKHEKKHHKIMFIQHYYQYHFGVLF